MDCYRACRTLLSFVQLYVVVKCWRCRKEEVQAIKIVWEFVKISLSEHVTVKTQPTYLLIDASKNFLHSLPCRCSELDLSIAILIRHDYRSIQYLPPKRIRRKDALSKTQLQTEHIDLFSIVDSGSDVVEMSSFSMLQDVCNVELKVRRRRHNKMMLLREGQSLILRNDRLERATT